MRLTSCTWFGQCFGFHKEVSQCFLISSWEGLYDFGVGGASKLGIFKEGRDEKIKIKKKEGRDEGERGKAS